MPMRPALRGAVADVGVGSLLTASAYQTVGRGGEIASVDRMDLTSRGGLVYHVGRSALTWYTQPATAVTVPPATDTD